MEEKDILALSARRKIYEIVQKYAGCHFREIQRISSLPAGIVKYHLDYLSRHEVIKYEKAENNIRYFPKEIQNDERKILSVLRSDSFRKILLFLISNEKVTHKEIVKFTNLSPSTVSFHLKKLIQKETIKFERIDGKPTFLLNIKRNKIIKLLIIYKESFFDSLVNRTIEVWEGI